MSLIDTATGEILDATYGEVKRSVQIARESGAKFFEQIVWQIERQAWTVLGYSSWDAMRAEEYGDMGVVVPRADRPEVVTRMRRVGLTQQQIADTIGVNAATVSRDLADASSDAVEITNARGQVRPASYKPSASPALGGAVDPVDAEQADDTEGWDADEPTPDDVPPSVQPERGAAEPPAPSISVAAFVESSADVRLTSWRKNFMAAIARSGEITLFDPADVADKADVQLIRELERLSQDINNYLSRVQAKRPHRLTAIRGGAQ